MSQKIFDNNLVATSRNTVALKLTKTEYDGMCVLH